MWSAAFVETHGRKKTAELLDGIEIVPRGTSSTAAASSPSWTSTRCWRGTRRWSLVDELAHTNTPGSKNAKRWQDVEELLDAGHHVISTVNVQHLESLNDVVAQITGDRAAGEGARRGGARRRPDRAGRHHAGSAAPQAGPRQRLRRRTRSTPRCRNYFRRGNLTALRELALLWLADQVDAALEKYRAEQQITDTWEARERVVVAVTGGPESETLMRRARGSRRASGAELMVVHVVRGDGLAGADPHRAAKVRELARGPRRHLPHGGRRRRAHGAAGFRPRRERHPAGARHVARGRGRARCSTEGIGAAVVQQSGEDRRAHGDPRRRRPAAGVRGSRAARCKPSWLAWGWFLAIAGPRW